MAPLVYEQLHRIATSAFRGERASHTLQATALVHESYERLIGADVGWKNRSHFFALAARMMRRILVDHARAKGAEKRGGIEQNLPIDDVIVVSPQVGEQVLDLHEALTQLADNDQRMADILELHYFGGLTYEEMGEVLNLSSSTLDRDIQFAKAWLRTKLEET